MTNAMLKPHPSGKPFAFALIFFALALAVTVLGGLKFTGLRAVAELGLVSAWAWTLRAIQRAP